MTIEQHFKELAAAQPIEGALLVCVKGDWQLDGVAIPTGPDGTRVAALLDTTSLGEILFRNGELIDERVGRIADGFRPAEKVPEGWSPSTSFVCIGVDSATRGQVMTFRGSSWGARHAFHSLNGGFARLGCRQYPIVTLATATRERSGNVVIDPVFRVVNWVPLESLGVGGAAAPALSKEAARAPQGKITITSGRQPQPVPREDEEPAVERPFAPPDDDIPF